MTLVAGIDSSTQACKVTIRDLATGHAVREGRAPHPAGTIIDPEAWWEALLLAVDRAGGLGDVAAVSVSGQQHTPVFVAADGSVVRPSPQWNDMGSHRHMEDLNRELGRSEWIRRTGLPLTVSDTVTKLRWLRDLHPEDAARTAAVAVVHDWLTWRLCGFGPGAAALDELVTDRSEASGTGYWSGETEDYAPDLVELALGRVPVLPRILGPRDRAGVTASHPGIPAGLPVGVGSGDNAAAALALGISEGDAVLSLGTSGVVYTRSSHPIHDYDGYACSYADATGEHLPLVATLNAARNFDAVAGMLGVSHAELSELALAAPPGAEGVTLLPYFEGERTPDLPHARASLHGASLANLTPANVARAVVEGTLVGQIEMLDALAACGVAARRLLLIGGAAKNVAVRSIVGELVDLPVLLPADDQYVTMGAAMQAAAAIDGVFPGWSVSMEELPAADPQPRIREQHDAAKRAMGYLAPGDGEGLTRML
jgi:xylulokinase